MAQGDVRCGRCFGTFNALENLEDQAPAVRPTPPPPILVPAPAAGTTEAPVTLRTQEIVAEIESRAKPESLALEAQQSTHFGLWTAASLLLTVTLVLQYGFFNRTQLAQSHQLRPLAEELCAVLFCSLPPQTDLSKLQLSNRDIRLHPSQPKALLVEATLVNQADFAQAFPVLELTFHDITGQIIAGRRFQPFEYLDDKAADQMNGMPPRQPYRIKLELADPGNQAVGFEFNFL